MFVSVKELEGRKDIDMAGVSRENLRRSSRQNQLDKKGFTRAFYPKPTPYSLHQQDKAFHRESAEPGTFSRGSSCMEFEKHEQGNSPKKNLEERVTVLTIPFGWQPMAVVITCTVLEATVAFLVNDT
ncbi:hypothetical protein STEG23_005404 [Scotinomys teguina]